MFKLTVRVGWAWFDTGKTVVCILDKWNHKLFREDLDYHSRIDE